MSQKKLYVGGLPYQTTEEQLHELFSTIGEITYLRIVTDKMNGRSKGFAFVEMATDEGAQAAISQLNGKEFGGRKLIVSEAKPFQPKKEGFFNRGAGGGEGGGHHHRGAGAHRGAPENRTGFRRSNRRDA